MKTAYFLVFLLALTFVPEHADAWFFRSVRRIRVNVYHKLGCMAACRWARSWACKVCKRKRGLGAAGATVDPVEDADVPSVLHELDVNGDGFVELNEIAHVTGLKETNPILVEKFHLADTDGDAKLDLVEFEQFHFDNKSEFLEATKEDEDVPDAA